MTSPQWMITLSLALEIPFDSNEQSIWSKLFVNFSKFGDIFITTLLTIDIVRLPFIDYSLIKYYNNYDLNTKSKYETIFKTLQVAFQIHMKQRITSEVLDLEETDNEQLKINLDKLHDKIKEITLKQPQDKNLQNIISFIDSLKIEIKELEEKETEE